MSGPSRTYARPLLCFGIWLYKVCGWSYLTFPLVNLPLFPYQTPSTESHLTAMRGWWMSWHLPGSRFIPPFPCHPLPHSNQPFPPMPPALICRARVWPLYVYPWKQLSIPISTSWSTFPAYNYPNQLPILQTSPASFPLDGKLHFDAKKMLTYMITKGKYFLSICIGKN